MQVDFAVIGGGIAGASVAYELAGHGSVALFEQEVVTGYHTTGRSAALFTEAYEWGLVRLLAMASRSFLEAPPPGFADEPILTPQPVLLIGTAEQRSAVESAHADAVAAVPGFRLVDGDEALALCPVLRPGYVDRAGYEPSSKSIDVHALHQGFLAAARRRGAAVLVSSPVTGLATTNGGWLVTAPDTETVATVVVNASGAWGDEVAAMAGVAPVDLVPHRRTAFTFNPPEGVDPRTLPMVVDADEQFYFKPEGIQFLGSLAEQTAMPPHDVRHEEADVALAIERIESATTLRIRTVQTAWAGLRTFAPDRLPVVGMDPDRSGFFWLVGQGGFGIMTSPAISRAACGLIVDGRLPDDLGEAGITAEALGPARLRR